MGSRSRHPNVARPETDLPHMTHPSMLRRGPGLPDMGLPGVASGVIKQSRLADTAPSNMRPYKCNRCRTRRHAACQTANRQMCHIHCVQRTRTAAFQVRNDIRLQYTACNTRMAEYTPSTSRLGYPAIPPTCCRWTGSRHCVYNELQWHTIQHIYIYIQRNTNQQNNTPHTNINIHIPDSSTMNQGGIGRGARRTREGESRQAAGHYIT